MAVCPGAHTSGQMLRGLCKAYFSSSRVNARRSLPCVLCRPGDVALMGGQEGTEVGPLKLLDDPRFRFTEGSVPRYWGLLIGKGKLDILRLHDRRGGQEHGPLDDGVQLSDVPWPGIHD